MTSGDDARRLINMPDADEFARLASQAFARGRLTNNGEFARLLEERLARWLDVEHLVLTSSGTLALQVAYRALDLKGKVITSPFTWTTTASSLAWTGLVPRFADIDSLSFNIDPAAIAARIDRDSRAILPVHTFGNPADIDAIEALARRHGLRTIYDGAQAFGARWRGRSVFAWGDAVALSLHATKLFHTVEGGAVVLRDGHAAERARLLVNNGIDAGGRIRLAGINGRISELHAAVGLALLDDMDAVLARRAAVARALRDRLGATCEVELQQFDERAAANYAYFPIVFPDARGCERAMASLEAAGWRTRRYFDASLNGAPYVEDPMTMPVAESLSRRILCVLLPIDASVDDAAAIAGTLAAQFPRRARRQGPESTP